MTKLILLIGPTGSGKSVQAEELLRRHTSWAHLSSGDLLRRDPVATAAIAAGELVSSQEVERIVSQALLGATAPVVLLDGFPRTIDQVRWLDTLALDNELTIAAVLVLNVDDGTIHERLALRGRGDDAEAAIDAKLTVYRREVLPVIFYYDEEGMTHHVDGRLSVGELADQIEEIIHV